MPGYKPPLAWGKALIARRKAGERIGLVIVAVHDWDAGAELAARPNTARVVVPEDKLPHELDWSPCVALDVIVMGECAEPAFWAAVTMLYAAGAASIWGCFEDGIWRLERWVSRLFPTGFYAAEGPFPEARLGGAIKRYRDWALMTRAGVYGTKLFDAARAAVFESIFGERSAHVMAWVDEHASAA